MLDGVGISKVRMKENTITNRRQGVIPTSHDDTLELSYFFAIVLFYVCFFDFFFEFLWFGRVGWFQGRGAAWD